MPFCRFAEGAGMYDVTPIENMFLLEYLPSAPEGFLRVYLYARMLTLHPELGEDIADVARALRMDEESVYNAMTYWERQGLVCRLTDRPPTYQLLSVNGAAARDPMEADYYELRDFNASLQSLFGPENLLGPKQYAMAYDWLNVYGYTQDAALRLVEFQVKKSRSKSPSPARIFKKADEMAGRWAAARRAHAGGRGEGDPLRRSGRKDGLGGAQTAGRLPRAVGGRDASGGEMAGRMGLYHGGDSLRLRRDHQVAQPFLRLSELHSGIPPQGRRARVRGRAGRQARAGRSRAARPPRTSSSGTPGG